MRTLTSGRHGLLPFSVIAIVLLAAQGLQAAGPRLSVIIPRGVQRGVETTLTFSGTSLHDAEEILFYEEGFEVTKLEAKTDRQTVVTLKVAPEARLGEHVAQIRTRSGVSDYKTFYVSPFPVVNEKEPNTDFETPQDVTMNVTVHGKVDNEDVDYYRVPVKKGERLSIEIEAMRLGSFLFDPYIAILDSRRFELSAVDDLPLLNQDGACSIVAEEDGNYYVMVREAAYGGNGASRYRLHIGSFPRPTAVYPAGGKRGTKVDVTFLNDPTGEIKAAFDLPTEADDKFGLFATDGAGSAPSPNRFRVSDYDNVLEQEPNNSRDQGTVGESTKSFNGIIQTPGDEDYFRFTAKKGQSFEVECYARRLRSPLDPVMYLYQMKDGRQLASNDDSRGPDSYFRFAVPEDGEYAIRIRDHLGRGGSAFCYRVELQARNPRVRFSIPRITRYGQERQQIAIPQGGRFATQISATRTDFGGELVLDMPELPEGVTMTAFPMPANMTSMPVLFEAKADAPIQGHLIPLTGRHADPKQNITGQFYNTADLIRGQNNVIMWGKAVRQVPIAVTEAAPYAVEVVQPTVPLVRNGSLALKVVVKRSEGFTAPIKLEFPYRPPGVSTSSSVTIPEGKSEAIYTLNGNASAALGEWKGYVIGSSNVKGELIVSSQLFDYKIAEPYVTIALDRIAVEQGQEIDMLAKVTVNTPFEGDATLQLFGLPHKVVTTEQKLNKGVTELTFHITTDPTSPAGRHKNIFAQITIPQNGQSIVHRAGTTEVRVDKPLPKPKPKAEPKAVAKTEPKPTPKPVAKPPKPLSRLEQLRLEAQKRREAEAAGNK